MMTAQQYFEELSAGLDRLDAAAREDIIAYYREYAQEAGLSSYDQLSEHFGTPRALCDSLSAELSGTAPLPSSPAVPEQKIPAAVRSILVMLSGQKRDAGTDPQPSECEIALDAFSGIDLSVFIPDVVLQEGDSFSVRYRLPECERLECAEVVDGLFRFRTAKTRTFLFSSSGGEVIITVPKGTRLQQAEFRMVSGLLRLSGIFCGKTVASTVSGDITLCGGTPGQLSARTTSGDLLLRDVTASSLHFGTVSGDVRVEGCHSPIADLSSTSGDLHLHGMACECCSVHTIAGDVEIDGSLGTLKVSTTSGDCTLSGTLTGQSKVTTVSGEIDVHFPGVGVDASSLDGITLDGCRCGKTASRPGKVPLILNSTSGHITVTTG